MNDTIQGVRFGGRRFKPVALGVSILMLGLVVASVFRLGTFSEDHAEAFIALQAVSAATSLGLLAWGWWKSSVKFAEWGLLVGTFAYLLRAVYLLIEDPLGDSVLLAFGVLVIIGGSYVLEVQDKDGEK